MNTLNWIFTGLIALLLIPYALRVWKFIKKFLTSTQNQGNLELQIETLKDELDKFKKFTIKELEKDIINNLVENKYKQTKRKHKKNKYKSEADKLGISERTLFRRLKDAKETHPEDLDGRIGGKFNNPPKEKTRQEKQALQAAKYEKYGRDWYLANKERISKKQRKTRLQKLRENPNHDILSTLKAEYNGILDICHPTKEDILEEVFTNLVGKEVSIHTPLANGSTTQVIKKIEDLSEMHNKLLTDWKNKVETRIYKRRYARATPELKKIKKRITKLTNQFKNGENKEK